VSAFHLELLPAEYQAVLVRLHRIEDRLLLAGTFGLLVSAGAAAFAVGDPAALNLGYAWAAPLPFLATTVILLALLSQRLATLCRLADLRQQAGVSQTEPANPYTPFLLRLLALPLSGAVLLYGLTGFVSWRAIYTASPLAGTLFGLTYSLLTLVTLLAGWGVQRQACRQAPLTFSLVRQGLLPYPAEFITGSGLFTAGWLAALLTVGVNTVQLPLLDAIFRRNQNFTQTVPLAAIAALGFLAFAVIEGLLVPAGRLWRDLRTARAAEAPTRLINFGYAHVLVRLGLALPLAFWLGGAALLTLALLIWLQLAMTAMTTPATQSAISPRAAAGRARFSLLWGALLYSLRFYGGVLIWVGPAWSFTILLLLLCTVSFLAVGFTAARRVRLARIQSVEGVTRSSKGTCAVPLSNEGPSEERGLCDVLPADPTASQALTEGASPATGEETALAYDLHSTPRWQRAGFLAAAVTAFVLVVLQALAESPSFFNDLLANSYGFNNQGTVAYHLVGLLNSLLLTFDLLILGLLACAGLVRLLDRSKAAWILFTERIRPVALPLLLAIAAGLFVAAFAAALPSLAMGGLLAGAIGAALWAER
jgi:hypothetical protein